MIDESEAAYQRLCDAQTDLNALLDRDDPPPDRVTMARAELRAAREAYRACVAPDGGESEAEHE